MRKDVWIFFGFIFLIIFAFMPIWITFGFRIYDEDIIFSIFIVLLALMFGCFFMGSCEEKENVRLSKKREDDD